MCTVSWLRTPGGYELLFNRDELRSRKAASLPVRRQSGAVRFLAPADGDAGGSWIATNQYGVTVCLLNGNGDAGGARRTRGEIVLNAAAAASAHEAMELASQLNLTLYRPFRLLAIGPGLPASLFDWDGSEAAIHLACDRLAPLSSSSFLPAIVVPRRKVEFDRLADCGPLSVERLLAFHQSHGGEPGPSSVCMHRPDAATVSFSWISVQPGETAFFYSPDAPCKLARKGWAGTLEEVEDAARTLCFAGEPYGVKLSIETA